MSNADAVAHHDPRALQCGSTLARWKAGREIASEISMRKVIASKSPGEVEQYPSRTRYLTLEIELRAIGSGKHGQRHKVL